MYLIHIRVEPIASYKIKQQLGSNFWNDCARSVWNCRASVWANIDEIILWEVHVPHTCPGKPQQGCRQRPPRIRPVYKRQLYTWTIPATMLKHTSSLFNVFKSDGGWGGCWLYPLSIAFLLKLLLISNANKVRRDRYI